MKSDLVSRLRYHGMRVSAVSDDRESADLLFEAAKELEGQHMSRRDHFAAAALSLITWELETTSNHEVAMARCQKMAAYTVIMADALIAELDKHG